LRVGGRKVKKIGAAIIGLLDILIAFLGLLIWVIFSKSQITAQWAFPVERWPFLASYEGTGAILVLNIFLLASITFFGTICVNPCENAMITAMTSSILVVYFFLLGVSVFLSQFTMISNFTWVVGFVVVSYIFSSAYIQIHSANLNKKEEVQEQPSSEP
jgi:hypothetical protein